MKRWFVFIWILLGVLCLANFVRNVFYEKQHDTPYIYYLQDSYNEKYYVYPDFRETHECIRYLFDFANKHPGDLHILTYKDDVYFERKQDYYNESIKKHHHFVFARQDSGSINNKFIIVNHLDDLEISFQVEEKVFSDSIRGKKLKIDVEKVNVNIIQQFLNYSFRNDYNSRSSNENYIYTLYSKSDSLIIKQTYIEYGKSFAIEMY